VISDNIVHNNVYLRLHLQTLSIFHPSIGITLHNFSTGCGNKRENARQPIFGFSPSPGYNACEMPPRMLPSICNRFQVNFGKVSLYPEVTDLRS